MQVIHVSNTVKTAANIHTDTPIVKIVLILIELIVMVSKRIREGRFPANLLVSDDVLNDGRIRISKYAKSKQFNGKSESHLSFLNNRSVEKIREGTDKFVGDSGSYSRYFDLDAWYDELVKTD